MDTYQADFLKRKNNIKNIPGWHLSGRQNTEPERELSGGAQGAQGNKNKKWKKMDQIQKNGSNTIILLSYLMVLLQARQGGQYNKMDQMKKMDQIQ